MLLPPRIALQSAVKCLTAGLTQLVPAVAGSIPALLIPVRGQPEAQPGHSLIAIATLPHQLADLTEVRAIAPTTTNSSSIAVNLLPKNALQSVVRSRSASHTPLGPAAAGFITVRWTSARGHPAARAGNSPTAIATLPGQLVIQLEAPALAPRATS